jgi:hypothetical protein
MRKRRSDRNYVIYKICCEDTGDNYVGLTVARGRAYLRSVRTRWTQHVSRAEREQKEWELCCHLRKYPNAEYTVQILDVIRGRAAAYQLERELIASIAPTLNTF